MLIDPPGIVLDLHQPNLVVTPQAIAHFLRHTPGLQRTQIGEYIGKGPAHLFPLHAKVLKDYVKTFNFSGILLLRNSYLLLNFCLDEGTTLDKGLRLFLSAFRLPGEAQCIDRIMESFAHHYYTHHPHPFLSADACFILSFSLIMLNTDLHNAQIPLNKKMTKDQFVRNNRGINDGKDLPKEYLLVLYDEIQAKQIEVDVDMDHIYQYKEGGVDVTEPHIWDKLIHRNRGGLAPAAFTPNHAARKSFYRVVPDDDSTISRDLFPENLSSGDLAHQLTHSIERDMFVAVCAPAWRTVATLWLAPIDDQYLPK